MKCRHGHFWIMGDYAWCPVCGALRRIKYSPDEDGYVFSWKRWVVPGDRERAHKVLKFNDRNRV